MILRRLYLPLKRLSQVENALLTASSMTSGSLGKPAGFTIDSATNCSWSRKFLSYCIFPSGLRGLHWSVKDHCQMRVMKG